MKKSISAVLSLLLAVLLCACGSRPSAPAVSADTDPAPSEVIVQTPEPVDERAEKYDSAVSLMKSGDFESAAAIFEQLGDYSASAQLLEDCLTELNRGKYEEAVSLSSEGKYSQAAAILENLGDYEDAPELLVGIREILSMMESMKNAQKGDSVTFGSYEQDGNPDDGKEPVEWIVLERNDDSLLLLSRYILDCKAYNGKMVNCTWETSSIREWMNSSFKEELFNETELGMMKLTAVPAAKNPRFNSDPGNDTEDMIWLLSADEAEEYLGEGTGATTSTVYASGSGTVGIPAGSTGKGKTTITVDRPAGYVPPAVNNPTWNPTDNRRGGGGSGQTYLDYSTAWWLRPPGDTNFRAVYINYKGVMPLEGFDVDFDHLGVRPVIRVSIES